MANSAIKIELEDALWESTRFAAHNENITPDEFIAQALNVFLDQGERTAIEEGFRDIDAGNFVVHEKMLRRLEDLRLRANKAA